MNSSSLFLRPCLGGKGFAAAVARVPGLLTNTTSELEAKFRNGNGRVNYTLALLA